MDRLLLLLLGVLHSACRSRADLVLENAALRRQLGVLMRAGRRSARGPGGGGGAGCPIAAGMTSALASAAMELEPH